MAEEPQSTDQPPSAPPTTPGPRPPSEPAFNVPGFVGLLFAVAGFTGFCIPPFYFLGTIGMGVGVFGLFRPQRTLAIVAIIIGSAATLFGIITLMAEPPASPEVVPPP